MDIIKNFIVEKGRAFLPIIFTDMVVSTKFLAVGGVMLAKEVNHQKSNKWGNKMDDSHIFERVAIINYSPLKVAGNSSEIFNKSITDIDIVI